MEPRNVGPYPKPAGSDALRTLKVWVEAAFLESPDLLHRTWDEFSGGLVYWQP